MQQDAMVFQKGSEFQAPFSYFLQRLHQGGQIDKIMRKYVPTVQEQCGNVATVIGYQNTVSAFVVLSLGALSAFLLLLVEMSLACQKKKVVAVNKIKRLLLPGRTKDKQENTHRGWEKSS